jgi:hypothetical protein
VADKILRAGKYLNVIRECGRDITLVFFLVLLLFFLTIGRVDSQTPSQSPTACGSERKRSFGHFVLLGLFLFVGHNWDTHCCNLVLGQVDGLGPRGWTWPFLTFFFFFAHSYVELIERAFNFASRSVIDLLMRERQLLERLR